jgi:hypothetical protein
VSETLLSRLASIHAEPCWLRFDLGGEWEVDGAQVSRFLQAIDRARTISEALFAGSSNVVAIIETWGIRRPSPRARTFRRLESMGFNPPLTFSQSHHEPGNDPEGREHYFLSGPTTPQDRAVLIWDACAKEIGIEPSSTFISAKPDQFSSRLVDFERGILVHVYDDRGVHVAASRDVLRPLYVQFNGWIQDYERPRIDALFRA